jgi:hypothetical protein
MEGIINSTIEDCTMGDERSADAEAKTPQSKRLKVTEQIKIAEQIKVEWSHLRICQPANGDNIIEVRYEPDGPDVTYCDVRTESDDRDVSYGGITLYLTGLHNGQSRAAVAFCTSHFGAYDNEPSHIAAGRWEKMVAVITKMVGMIQWAYFIGPARFEQRCLTDIFRGACKYSHSTMTFDKEDLATKLRLIASGKAREYDSYTALRCD